MTTRTRLSTRTQTMLMALICAALIQEARAVTLVFEQPPTNTGALLQSSFFNPDGSDYDIFSWDNFTIGTSQAITEVRWRGGYINNQAYSGPVFDFTVAIYASIAAGTQPDVSQPPLRRYHTNNNAGETVAGVFGGKTLYDYHFTLPAAFQAVAGTKYWIQIVGYQNGIPDWGYATGSGGNGSYFRYLVGGPYYQAPPGDAAFSLWASDSTTNYTISASASPAGAGTVTGAGVYPSGSVASLTATPAAGYGFVNWTQNGTQVSTSATYNFTVTANRTLVANFVPAYTIITSSYPSYGGTTTGAGVYNSGATVTLIATPNPGFVFTQWSDGATTATHSFAAAYDLQITAFFQTAPNVAAFDFDNAPVHTSLPLDQTVNGLTAHLSATGSGFSIQQVGTVGIAPAGMSGLLIYPNSVFAADLLISFSETLTDFSILYSTQELACDSSATMRVTAYMNGAFAGTNTMNATPYCPCTWTSATLAISVPAGFNSVVVHYDAHPPPPCQDYGVIFLADNMIVTRSCASAAVVTPPVATSTCSGSAAGFSVSADGSPTITYQWQAETALNSNTFYDLVDGPTGTGSTVLGAQTPGLTLSAVSTADAVRYRCVVGNGCGSATSNPAALNVIVATDGDVNGDGLVNGLDLQPFVDLLQLGWAFDAASCAADLNKDGWVDEFDLPQMVTLLLGA